MEVTDQILMDIKIKVTMVFRVIKAITRVILRYRYMNLSKSVTEPTSLVKTWSTLTITLLFPLPPNLPPLNRSPPNFPVLHYPLLSLL